MTDVILIAVIGVLFVAAVVIGSAWIIDRTNDFLAFVFTLVLSFILWPLILIWIIQS